MIGREQIETIKIEPRNSGKAWNITLFVKQKWLLDYSFGDLVTLAAEVLGEAKGLSLADGWGVGNAEVMAWSDRGHDTGVHTPYEYRVTLDMRRFGCEAEDGDDDDDDDDEDDDEDSMEVNDGR